MTRKCAVCRVEFEPRQSFQTWCDIPHGVIVANRKLEKIKQADAVKERRAEKKVKLIERRADKIKRETMKTMGKLIAEAQTAFNAFIRERDRRAYYPCISSGRTLDWTGNAVDAGHYRSRGSAPHLRFDERNCNAQSKQENRYASGNATGYRIGLIAKIGIEAVEALEADQTPKHYSRDDLIEIKKTYAAKARELQKEKA